MNPSTITKKCLLPVLFFICLFSSASLRAQESDLVEFLRAGKQDASKLMNAYMNPMIEGLSYGLNGGWAQTAKAHKTLGFDFMINANAVFIPSSKNYFDPGKLGLTTVTSFQSDNANGMAPTIVGPADGTTYTTQLDVNGDGTPDQSFDISGPEGLDLKKNIKVSGVVVPTATLGIGIYKNTDIKIRWMPEIEASDSKVKLFGLGVMHDVKQHIPGIKLLPFDLSVMGSFTKVKGYSSLEGVFAAPQGGGEQRINYELNAWLVQAMISKKFSVITLYGALGYNAVKTTSDVVGSYVIYDNPSGNDLVYEDPISMTFKNNGFRATAGFRLKLAVICLSADYTLQEYSTLSVGFGIAVR
ncbi:DUF6588 family protein [Pseudochryseolinea flava]|uniref:Uncharacterized protein n=1 Tax=Pseudochryseolinea flava TaxID=2059302 RepID=A0A364Y043_9BACT|nr:DUF6588 family protein [Pseudochryseolinea flava]RAV99098.1 hypothetical protein DQQ10_21115 [Pseudochryseolinea flava]